MELVTLTNYRQVGGRLGAYIRASNPSTQQIQGLLADLLAGDPLLPTMRDVVSMPAFAALQGLAGSGVGAVPRDSLLEELAHRYVPKVLDDVRQLIDGLLDQPLRTTPDSSNRTPSNDTSYSKASPHTSALSHDEYSSNPQQWGWDDYAEESLPGWVKRTSSEKQVKQKQYGLAQSREKESHPNGISLSDLAKEMKVPAGLLIQWCKRMGFESSPTSEYSIIPTIEAVRIAIGYRHSSIGIFGQPLITTMAIGVLLVIISVVAR